VTSFDPAAATAAYLAALPPAAHEKAIHYTQGGHWLILWGWLVEVVVAVLILHSGLLHRTRKRIDGTRRRPILASVAVIGVFLALDWLFSLPWQAYAGWWREKQYGLTSQAFAGWLGEAALGAVLTIVGLGLFLALLYALIRRAPRTWWIWAAGVWAVMVMIAVLIAPVFIEPLFNRYTPAPPGPVRDQVVALAKTAHVPSDKIYIYDGSKQSNRYTANVSGLFGSARVAMSDVMFQKGADLAEVRGVVGHEMGHYARGHAWWTAIWLVIEALIGFFLIQLWFEPVAAFLQAHVSSIADPAGLPVLMILIATFQLLATPLDNTVTRLEEADADRFSLKIANEPDGLSRALVKTIEYRADSPSAFEEFVFYDHPSVRRRVRSAMDWKAAHLNAAADQGEKTNAAQSP